MYGINEIQKQNARTKAEQDNWKVANWTKLRHGGILLSFNGRSKTLDEKEDIAEFHAKIKGDENNSARVRHLVESYFPAPKLNGVTVR